MFDELSKMKVSDFSDWCCSYSVKVGTGPKSFREAKTGEVAWAGGFRSVWCRAVAMSFSLVDTRGLPKRGRGGRRTSEDSSEEPHTELIEGVSIKKKEYQRNE